MKQLRSALTRQYNRIQDEGHPEMELDAKKIAEAMDIEII